MAIDIREAPLISVSTASGVEKTPIVELETVDISGFIHREVETVILPLPAEVGVDGLLGMSFIRRCRMTLDVPERTLVFESD